MRFALVAVLALVTGGAGAYYSTKKTAPTFASQYISMMEHDPNVIREQIATTWKACLPPDAQALTPSQDVGALLIDTIARSTLYMAEEKSPDEASKLLILWVLQRAEMLSETEQKIFVKLGRLINSVDVQVCIMSSLRDSQMFKLHAAVEGWELRQ